MIAIRSAIVLTIFRGRRYVFFSCILPSPYLFFCFPPARFGHRPRSQEVQLVSSSHASEPYKPVTKSPHCIVDPLQPGFTNRTHTKRSVKAGVVHHRRWASSPIARTDRVPLKPASFTTEGGRLHYPSSTCYGRLHQSHAHKAFR